VDAAAGVLGDRGRARRGRRRQEAHGAVGELQQLDAAQGVGAVAPADRVDHGRAARREGVVGLVAGEHRGVGAGAAGDDVVAAGPGEGVVVAVAGQGVGAGRADDVLDVLNAAGLEPGGVAGAEVDRQVAGRAGIVERIGAAAKIERDVLDIADVAAIEVQHLAAGDDRGNGVVAGGAGDDDGVAGGLAGRAAVDGGGAVAGNVVDRVVAAAAVDNIGARAAGDDVVLSAAGDGLGRRGAVDGDGVGAGRPRV